jgi:hypothetical protein
MDDTLILFTGISVFGLMLIAIVLTVLEFRDLDERPGKDASRKPQGNEDRD